jgi:hypothetical protein
MTPDEFVKMLSDLVDEDRALSLYARIDPSVFELDPMSDAFLERLDAELDRILAEEGVEYVDDLQIQTVSTVEVLEDPKECPS